MFIYIFIPKIPKLGTGRLKNEIGHVTHQSIGNFVKKIFTFRGQKGKNRPPEPKNGIWVPKLVCSCDISIDLKFYIDEEEYTFGGQKGEYKP
jgi:hypothetical protein